MEPCCFLSYYGDTLAWGYGALLLLSYYGDTLASGYGALLLFSYFGDTLAWGYGALLLFSYYGDTLAWGLVVLESHCKCRGSIDVGGGSFGISGHILCRYLQNVNLLSM